MVDRPVVTLAYSAKTWIAIGSIGTFVCRARDNPVALLTRKLAGATEQSARAARDAVEAMEEPFIIAVPTPLGTFLPRAAQSESLPPWHPPRT
jgi:hypothetical protein